MITGISRSSRQLDFVSVSRSNEVFVGASNIINSGCWNGDLVYYLHGKEIPFDSDLFLSENGIKHAVHISVGDGCFLDERKVIVGNDCGMLAMYVVASSDAESENDKLSFYNNVCSVEHSRGILTISLSPNTNKVATGGMDRIVKIWDLENFVALTTYFNAHSNHVTSIRHQNSTEVDSVSGNIFLSTSLDGFCLLWDSRQKYPAQIVSESTDNSCGYTTSEWIDSNMLFLGCESGDIYLSDIRNTKKNRIKYCLFNNYINKIALSKQNHSKFFAVCEDNRTVKVFHFVDDQLEEIYSNNSHRDYVKCVAWLNKPEEQILLSCSWDSSIIQHYPFRN